MTTLTKALQYALRSWLRQWREHFFSHLTIGCGILTVIFLGSFSYGVLKIWESSVMDTGVGHVQIHGKNFFRRSDEVSATTFFSMQNPQVLAAIAHTDTKHYSPRVIFEGLVFSDKSTSDFFSGIAIDGEKELNVSPSLFGPLFDKGRFVSSERPLGATIGSALAQTLGVGLGESLTIVTKSIDGSVNARDLTVDGILEVPLPHFSKNTLYLPISTARQLLKTEDQSVNELVVRLKSLQEIHEFLQTINSAKNSVLRADGWWVFEPLVSKAKELWSIVTAIFTLLLAAMLLLILMNLAWISIIARQNEVQNLIRIGASPKYVYAVLCMERFFVGAVGAVVGSLVFFVIAELAHTQGGINFTSPFGAVAVQVPLVVHSGYTLAISTLCTGIISVFAGLPAILRLKFYSVSAD